MATRTGMRNGFQKIRAGDVVVYRDPNGRQTATITSKGRMGMMEATHQDGRQIRLFGCDVDGVIGRNALPREQ